MKPLTKAQGQMLWRIADYDHGTPVRSGILYAPLRRLVRRGLAEFYQPRKIGGWRFLRITEAGRNALKKFNIGFEH